MKKLIVAAIVLVCSDITVFASDVTIDKMITDTTKTQSKKVEVEYTCGMHPDVISKRPGRCPKCGMELIQKDTIKKKPALEKMKM